MAMWISKPPEANINCQARQVMRDLSVIQLQDDKQLVSLVVVGLFTNVLVNEAIEYTSDLMYSDDAKCQPPVDKDTFISLLELVSVDVVFSTNQAYFKQTDGVAVCSPAGPLLATVFMSKFDHAPSLFSPFYYRYIDDFLRTMVKGGENILMDFVNPNASDFEIHARN